MLYFYISRYNDSKIVQKNTNFFKKARIFIQCILLSEALSLIILFALKTGSNAIRRIIGNG